MADTEPSLGALTSASRHWSQLARRWREVGSPLRPAPEDIAIYRGVVDSWCQTNGAPRVLLLGVTPEIYGLPWPQGTEFIAVDRSEAMIAALWSGMPDEVICANWVDLPLEPASRDLVFQDGGLHLLKWPDEQQALVNQLARIVPHGGLVILRLFVPPAVREEPAQVLRNLQQGRIRDLNILKLRLGMSLQQTHGQGVRLANVWSALHDAAPDFAELAERIGWRLEHLEAINSYKDSSDEYCFVTTEQALDIFCRDGSFSVESVTHPPIEMGDQCPIVVLRRG